MVIKKIIFFAMFVLVCNMVVCQDGGDVNSDKFRQKKECPLLTVVQSFFDVNSFRKKFERELTEEQETIARLRSRIQILERSNREAVEMLRVVSERLFYEQQHNLNKAKKKDNQSVLHLRKKASHHIPRTLSSGLESIQEKEDNNESDNEI